MTDYLGPHWESAALVVIDVQNDFLEGGAAPVAGTREVLPALAETIAAFLRSGRPIAHIVRFYQPGGCDVDLPRRAAVEAGRRTVVPGSPGSQIPSVLLPAEVALDSEKLLAGAPQTLTGSGGEVVFFKPRWSAFHRTGLESWLQETGCDTVVVAGCNLPNCPRATLFDASERDFRTVLVTDAVSQVTPERLVDLEGIGVQLRESAQVVDALSRS